MAFLLLPKTWHRYRPDPETGWQEGWVELAGPVPDELLRVGTFSPSTILRLGAIGAGLDELFARVHQRFRKGAVGDEPELAAISLQILALLTRKPMECHLPLGENRSRRPDESRLVNLWQKVCCNRGWLG